MSHLENKVRVVNHTHRLALKYHKMLANLFKPFVGTKIYQDGIGNVAFIPKLQQVLKKSNIETAGRWEDRRKKFHIYLGKAQNAWSVKFELSVSSMNSHHCTTFEVGIMDEDLETKILTKLSPLSLRTNYTSEEIAAKRTLYCSALQHLEEVKKALLPFEVNRD